MTRMKGSRQMAKVEVVGENLKECEEEAERMFNLFFGDREWEMADITAEVYVSPNGDGPVLWEAMVEAEMKVGA